MEIGPFINLKNVAIKFVDRWMSNQFKDLKKKKLDGIK
jgi:hypothetical protein